MTIKDVAFWNNLAVYFELRNCSLANLSLPYAPLSISSNYYRRVDLLSFDFSNRKQKKVTDTNMQNGREAIKGVPVGVRAVSCQSHMRKNSSNRRSKMRHRYLWPRDLHQFHNFSLDIWSLIITSAFVAKERSNMRHLKKFVKPMEFKKKS